MVGVNEILHGELPPNGYTITADLYCQQLDRLAEKLGGKQDRINFLHGNARPPSGDPCDVLSSSVADPKRIPQRIALVS